ncbi:DEKNAAC104192 [Brettanomyces naardenensis]|uniref:Glycerol-3-phosphate dehydrogenase n=1 Tax=Brettanomyces naardenensis TaxID=13370 RepID=A0A448YQ05_BRENA|nr:DEKNAAC104192 [Brettanomyces naardenensis]
MVVKIRARGLAVGSLFVAVGGLVFNSYVNKSTHTDQTFRPLVTEVPRPPSREDLLRRLGKPLKALGFKQRDVNQGKLSSSDAQSKFDLVVVGGGAVGTGTALDATLRGLNVLLVEKNDYASGTSSKSTKMAHGGVRYLEKAVFQLSKDQLDLVIESLHERASVLENAPHLAKALPICIPVYKWYQLPYFYAGCALYDLFAGSEGIRHSYVMTRNSTLHAHPQLDASGLVGGLVYYDGLFNDARMNVSLALTAEANGATVLNYMDVQQLLKDEEGKTKGIRVLDKDSGEEYLVGADAVIGAVGPYSDLLISMDKSENGMPEEEALSNPKMVVPSGGVHVILPEWYCAKDQGLLDSSTSDGRVMFFLPWQGKVLAGTTDVPLKKIPENPVATEQEISDILGELQRYVLFPVRREDVLSAWCGVRPLARDPTLVPEGQEVSSTQGLVRSHLIFEAPNGLITISGGKWTTYRRMAEDVTDYAIKHVPTLNRRFSTKLCSTRHHKLVGAEGYDPALFCRLAQKYNLTEELAKYLASNYGDRAPVICELFEKYPRFKAPIGLPTASGHTYTYDDFKYPFTLGELYYCLDYEQVRHPTDFLARRCRLAFLDANKALGAVDEVVDVMARRYGWSNSRKNEIRKETVEYIEQMGIVPNETPYGKL